jgi:hypothetical protein
VKEDNRYWRLKDSDEALAYLPFAERANPKHAKALRIFLDKNLYCVHHKAMKLNGVTVKTIKQLYRAGFIEKHADTSNWKIA